jgi:LacI family transcriptional regulator
MESLPHARATMRDVAALAGVAIKTVSRVINNVPTVDPELAARVRTAADKLGYRPNLTASNLRRLGGRTNTLGLLVEDVGNPFSAALHRAVEDVARERGVLLLTGSLDEQPAREQQLARTLIDRRVDGLIIVPAGDDHRYVVAEQRAGTAFAFVDRLPTPLVADAVVADNRAGAERGVRHLIDGGRRRIAYLGDDPTIETARERLAGYRDALSGAALPADPAIVRHGLRAVGAAASAALDLLTGERPPDAIFASQNLVTIGAVEALHQLGLHTSVALVGFDDFALANVLNPGVTVMAQDPAAMGRLAAERIFARLDGDRSPARVFTITTALVQRQSGQLPLSS